MIELMMNLKKSKLSTQLSLIQSYDTYLKDNVYLKQQLGVLIKSNLVQSDGADEQVERQKLTQGKEHNMHHGVRVSTMNLNEIGTH